MSVEYAAVQNYDLGVQTQARNLIEAAKLEMTEEWVKGVYNYFKFCYSPNEEISKTSDCIVNTRNELPANRHLGFLYIKKYFPDAQPRIDLISK
jgi:hypothetical protein